MVSVGAKGNHGTWCLTDNDLQACVDKVATRNRKLLLVLLWNLVLFMLYCQSNSEVSNRRVLVNRTIMRNN